MASGIISYITFFEHFCVSASMRLICRIFSGTRFDRQAERKKRSAHIRSRSVKERQKNIYFGKLSNQRLTIYLPSVELSILNIQVLAHIVSSRSKDENQQQTQPTFDAESGNRTRATLVGGKCSTTAPSLLPTITDLFVSTLREH